MSAQTLKLPEEITIKTVAALKLQLDESLASGQPAIIDGGAVGRIDGLGVQLLIAYVRAMGERDIAISWGEPSEPLVKVAAELGVRELGYIGIDRAAT